MDNETREQLQYVLKRMSELEAKVDKLLTAFEQGTGALLIFKWLGSFLIGIASLWALFHDHFTPR